MTRRPPCDICRRRHRRILVTGAAALFTSWCAIVFAAGVFSTPASAQLANVAAGQVASAVVSQSGQDAVIGPVSGAAVHPGAVPASTATASAQAAKAPSAVPVQTPATSPSAHAAVQAPAPTATQAAAPPPAATSSGGSVSARVLAEAETQAGVPYVYGGASPAGFDCSGLVYWAAQQLGITAMPRDTYEMLGQGTANGTLVATSSPQRGDLAFFGSGHVEFYISPGETFGAQQPGTSVGFHSYGYGYVPSAFYRIV